MQLGVVEEGALVHLAGGFVVLVLFRLEAHDGDVVNDQELLGGVSSAAQHVLDVRRPQVLLYLSLKLNVFEGVLFPVVGGGVALLSLEALVVLHSKLLLRVLGLGGLVSCASTEHALDPLSE